MSLLVVKDLNASSMSLTEVSIGEGRAGVGKEDYCR